MPRRFVVLDAADVDPVQDADLLPRLPHGMPVTIVYGFTLGAIPGKLPHVVVRGDVGAMDGRWYARSSFSAYPLIVQTGADARDRAVAESTGEVEVRDDGALAEVYRVAS